MFDVDLIAHGNVVLGIAVVLGFFMSFAIGANDVANAFASSVGAKAITIGQAVVIAGLMNLLGASLLGGNVSKKIVGLIDMGMFPSPDAFILAMMAVLLAAATFVLFSSLTGVPVSTTHAIIGSFTGVTLFINAEALDYPLLTKIVISWVISPVAAGLLALIVYGVIDRVLLKSDKPGAIQRSLIYVPYIVAAVVGVLLFSLLDSFELGQEKVSDELGTSLFLAFVLPYVCLLFQPIVRTWAEKQQDTREGVEFLFRRLQIGTSSFVSFAHGANDVANAITPVFAVHLILQSNGGPIDFEGKSVPFWILVLGGGGIALGVGLLGYRVIETLGTKVTQLTNVKGFTIDSAVATTVTTASILGLPVSSTHAATGAVVGVGVAEGAGKVNFLVLVKIVIAWLVTLPIAGGVAVGLYWLLTQLIR